MKNSICGILFCSLLLVACKDKPVVTTALPVFDLEKEYAERPLLFQDIADVEYVPLETTDESVVSGVAFVSMDEKNIVIYDSRTSSFVVFDRQGKFQKAFCHKGESGEEYRNTNGMAVDFKAREIYTFDYGAFAPSRIQVYDFEGRYVRTLDIPEWTLLKIRNYDEEYLFAEDVTYVDTESRDKARKQPYYLVSKQTGEMKQLPLYVKEREGSGLLWKVTDDGNNTKFSTSIYFPNYPISSSGERIFIADFGLDTIYTYYKDRLEPIAVKQNRLTKHGSTVMTEVCAQTDRYLLLCTGDKRLQDGNPPSIPDPQYLLYDYQSGGINRVILENADGITYKDMFENLSGMPHCALGDFPAGYALTSFRPSFLLEKYEKGELKGSLKEIASKLDVEDNPVLAIIKFKE